MGLNHGWRGPNIVRDGLVLYLDAGSPNSYQGTGTIWKDISKVNQNNGTLINGPTFDSGNGGSIVFDGTNDTVDFGNVLNLGINDLTINQWIKITSSLVSTTCSLSKAFLGGQNYRYALLYNGTAIRPFFQGNGGADIQPTTPSLNINQWYNVTVIFNRSSSINVFVNGIQQTLTGNNVISQWDGLNFQSPNPFRVGSYTGSGNSIQFPFPGFISTTLVYFKALSAQEVLQNYNATKGRFGL